MLLLIKDLFWPSYVRLLVFWIFCLMMAQWKIELERIQGLTFSYYNIFPSLLKNFSNIYQLILPFFHLTEVLFINSIVGKKWVSDLISKKKETHLLVPVYDSKLRRQNHTDTLTHRHKFWWCMISFSIVSHENWSWSKGYHIDLEMNELFKV